MILNLPTTIDFGQMSFGNSYSRSYIINNTTDSILEIKDLGRSCTCTEVSASKTLIKPKEQGIINVTVTPGSTGIFSRSFWFTLNNQRYTVTLTGHAS